MSEKGWIKLHREIRDNWVWEDPVTLKIWLDILLSANHEKRKVKINNNVIEIDRGQFFTSQQKLAARWNIDRKTVRKKLSMLQNDGMIFVDSSKKIGTLISVSNYATFQAISESVSPNTSPNTSPLNSPNTSPTDSPNASPQTRINKNDKRMIQEDIRPADFSKDGDFQ